MINEEGLRDWFGKSKSKDGKKGWVNVVTGDSCASDKPGEGVPKCVSSAKRASMSKKERLAAQAAKRREDPGQQQKSGAAKPTMVKTDRKTRKEEMEVNEARKPGESPKAYASRMTKKHSGGKSKTYDPMKDPNFDHDKAERTRGSMQEAADKKGKGSGKKDACYHKVKSRYSVWPSAYASGALVKCRKKGAANWGNSTKKEEMEGFYDLPELTEVQIAALKYAGYEVEVLDEKCWKGYEKKGMKTMFGKRYPNCVKKEEVEIEEKAKACWDTHEKVGMKMKGGKMVNDCRPKNRVKEEVEVVDEKINPALKGILKKTPKGEDPKKGGVPYKITGKMSEERERVIAGLTNKEENIDEAVRVNENGNVYLVSFTWRAKFMMIKLFFPEVRKPTRQEVSAALEKVYPGCMVQRFDLAPRQPGEPMLMAGYQGGDAAKPGPDKNYVKPMGEGYDPGDVDEKLGAVTAIPKKDRDAARDRLLAKAKAKREKMKKEGYEIEEGAAWTKKSGKNPSGGLNEKGRKSYERENPGSDLKAPSKKVGNKRRASFCARMKGMKKKLTSAKTANDPDSRINKSLRAWNC